VPEFQGICRVDGYITATGCLLQHALQFCCMRMLPVHLYLCSELILLAMYNYVQQCCVCESAWLSKQ
jgi:hypothetical protein